MKLEFVPDVRKGLDEVAAEWDGCTKCQLGKQRDEMGNMMVFGEGTPRGIMLVGEGPGGTEAEVGQPFVGPSGQKVLRPILRELRMEGSVYVTNIVACRSFVQQMDGNGQPVYRNNRQGIAEPVYQDTPPPPACTAECAPRFYQELYKVDPVVIVSMGAPATEFLLGRPVAITKIRGTPFIINVPGASYQPVLTEKRKQWIRGKSPDGRYILPVVQNTVQYLVIPTLHPAYALRMLTETKPDSPFPLILKDLKTAWKVYESYRNEVGK